MRTLAATLLLALLATACAAPESAEAPGSDTVPALRYRRLAYDAFAWHDGDGRLIEEIWFPDRGIVCNVTEEYRFEDASDGTTDYGSHAELHAFFSPILNRYPERFASETEIESPTEEIRVPRALAERIFRMAELDREMKEGRETFGREAVEAGLLRLVKTGDGK